MRLLAISVCLSAVMVSLLAPGARATVQVHVAPAQVLRNTSLKVTYRVSVTEAVTRIGAHRFSRRWYFVRLATSGGTGCVRARQTRHRANLVVRRGHTLANRLDPTNGSGQQWCPGRWTGEIVLVRDRCARSGSLVDCPSRTRVSRVVRRFHFRVGAGFAHTCRVADSETVLETSAARLYSFSEDDLWGCLKAVGRRVRLATNVNGTDGTYTTPRLAGDFVAYGAYEGSPCARYMQCPPGYAPNIYTAVVNLRSGARRVAPGSEPAFDALVLTASGAMAWIACPSNDCSAPTVRVHDSAGARVVDTGPGIDPRSLKLTGSTVSWTHTGLRRSMVLR